jgi:hypothetical protein
MTATRICFAPDRGHSLLDGVQRPSYHCFRKFAVVRSSPGNGSLCSIVSFGSLWDMSYSIVASTRQRCWRKQDVSHLCGSRFRGFSILCYCQVAHSRGQSAILPGAQNQSAMSRHKTAVAKVEMAARVHETYSLFGRKEGCQMRLYRGFQDL